MMSIQLAKRKSQFAHFLNHKISELKYRLLQVLEVCDESEQRFKNQQKKLKGEGKELNYRFTAFASLVQTFKDILPVITDQKVSWASLNNVKHIDFMRKSRNAITHDGNPIINMWADGKYYIACAFARLNNSGNLELIKAPPEDIATICIEFTFDLAARIRQMIEPLVEVKEFAFPMYDIEFFGEAILHPAIPKFARKLFQDNAKQSNQTSINNPLIEVCEVLDSLIKACNDRMTFGSHSNA